MRQLEDLPIDRNSRPLQDAAIANCGELVKQTKGESQLSQLSIMYLNLLSQCLAAKKEKKRRKRSTASEESASDNDEIAVKQRKDKLKKKRSRKESNSSGSEKYVNSQVKCVPNLKHYD